MDHILYILLLRDKTAFKVGITSNNNLSRIKQLHGLYDFDLNESFVIKSSPKNIKLLEKQLLTDYSFYKHILEEKSDGHTEFLKYECILNILDDIYHKIKKPHIKISIDKGIKFCDIINTNEPKISKPKIKYEKLPICYKDFDFDNLYKFLEIVEENKDSISILVETREQDNVKGERLILYSTDINIMHTLFQYHIIKAKNTRGCYVIGFIDIYDYDKEKNMDFMQLGGTYHKFEHEKRFDNIYVYTEYTNVLDKIKQMCKIIN